LPKFLKMTNKEIANSFNTLAKLMELHGENQFKIRSYQNAYRRLRSWEEPLEAMDETDINAIQGVGKAITGKIMELVHDGQMKTLQRYIDQTPPGIVEMLNIKGFGPKKIKAVWQGLGVESIGELLYAANENRLVALNGFGQKTQEDLKQKLEYYQQSKGKFLLAEIKDYGANLVDQIQTFLPAAEVSVVGKLRRNNNVVDRVEVLIANDGGIESLFINGLFELTKQEKHIYYVQSNEDIPVVIYTCEKDEFGSKLFRYSGSKDFLEAFVKSFPNQDFKGMANEKDIFDKAAIPFIQPEMRESEWAVELAKSGKLPVLIEESDIKGVLHAHSTYSDGMATLQQMAKRTMDLGYEYLGITDHSKSAFYANGLKPDRVWAQFQEVNKLNLAFAPFKIFKGIESDILNDGSLDYEDDLLAQFDFIIASVHSNLKMDETKATNRILKAVENPYTTILGHLTSRLLLSRKGYPVDTAKIIDACAANGVAIEINANPYRLDLDWRWIPYALERAVPIAINPDAHSLDGIKDIKYGVLSARKGGLTKESCLNSMTAQEFENFITK